MYIKVSQQENINVHDTCHKINNVVANLKLWERSASSPPFPFISFPSPPFLSLPFPFPLLSPLAGDNNFSDFPENQLNISLHFFASLLEGTLHRSACSDIICGNGVATKCLGGRRSPHSSSITPLHKMIAES